MLIEKITDPLDRRRAILRVSDLGRRKLALLSGYQRQGNDVLFERFDAKAFLKFSRLLEQVLPCSERAATLVTLLSPGKGSFGSQGADASPNPRGREDMNRRAVDVSGA